MWWIIGTLATFVVAPITIHLLRREETRAPLEKHLDVLGEILGTDERNNINNQLGKTADNLKVPNGYKGENYRETALASIPDLTWNRWKEEQKNRK